MTDTVEYRVDVTVHESTLIKIAWQDLRQDLFGHYLISRHTLQNAADKVRKALMHLVKKYVEVENKNSCGVTSDDKKSHRAGKELSELASAGFELYVSLFLAAGESPRKADDFKEWLTDRTAQRAREGKEIHINFTVDDQIYIPWGLMYDADPNALTGNAEDDALPIYQDFWCLKYKVVSSYNRFTELERDDSDPDRPMSILSVVHRSKYEGAVDQMDKTCDEEDKQLIEPRRKFIELLEQYKKPIFTSQDFYSEWKERGEKFRVIYFYCHADGSTLALDSEDAISIHDFKRRTKHPRQSQSCLVFLNGCVTAIGDDKGGFLEATSASIFCGFIGTETEVPDIFALRFGLDFLYYFFCKGWPVSHIMDYLRAQHWPLGLIYSTYCRRDFSTGQAVYALDLPLTGNFSNIPRLGTLSPESSRNEG